MNLADLAGLPIEKIVDVGGDVLKRVFPDPNERAKHELEFQKLIQAGNLEELRLYVAQLQGQMQINMKEAEHKSLFVSGWRPFVGWVCGIGLAYVALIEPLIRMIANLSGYTGEFPEIDTTLTMQVLMGMLGLGVMRMREREKGVATNSLKTWTKDGRTFGSN